jgi:DNA-binding transcriptional MerR regulator
MSETWTIGELAARASDVLRATSGNGAPNGRVREVPNERLIRWYTTIGLLDPPLARRGRVALYGRRHLLQLVAVKRLQAEGRSIAEIQVALAGATDGQLEAVAAVDDAHLARPIGRGDGTPATRPERERFWAASPGRLTAARATRTAPDDGSAPQAFPRPHDAATAGDPVIPPGAGLAGAVRLAPGVTLVLDGGHRTPSPDDLAAILPAAAPLLAVLAERGLAAPAVRTDRLPAEGSTR